MMLRDDLRQFSKLLLTNVKHNTDASTQTNEIKTYFYILCNLKSFSKIPFLLARETFTYTTLHVKQEDLPGLMLVHKKVKTKNIFWKFPLFAQVEVISI